jgi:hypothetical protein
MKKTILIGLLFVFACHQSNDKTNEFLNEGIENCNSAISRENEEYYVDLEASACENPIRNRPYKILIDKIKAISERIFKSINQRKTEILINRNQSQNEDSIITFFGLLKEYSILLDSIFPNDSIIQKKLKANFNFSKQESQNLSVNELNFILNKINNLNNIVLCSYIKKTETTAFRFTKKEVVVVPKSKYLHQNEIYEAYIYMVRTDSFPNYVLKINGKKISSGKGKVEYIDSFSYQPRKVFKRCELELESNSTGQIFTFPFILKYQFKGK